MELREIKELISIVDGIVEAARLVGSVYQGNYEIQFEAQNNLKKAYAELEDFLESIKKIKKPCF